LKIEVTGTGNQYEASLALKHLDIAAALFYVAEHNLAIPLVIKDVY
jgi:hypothetical protein